MTAAELAAARRVADAVLYEGYLLYPYRASATKNRLRWQFGVLSPAGAAEAGLGEQDALHAQCLLRPGPAARVEVRVRFLQVQDRTVRPPSPPGFTAVDGLRVGDASWVPWQEAVDREVVAAGADGRRAARRPDGAAGGAPAARTSSCCTARTARWSAGWSGPGSRWPRS